MALANELNLQEQKKSIQGKWSSIWGSGSSDKIDETVCFQFEGDKVYITFKKDVDPIERDFKIISFDKSGKGSIDFSNPSSQELNKGLYILKQDTLILFFPTAGEPRPKEISAYLRKDENILFYIFVRDK
ncbi:MAG: hypothetical protein KDA70_13430 [Planctomycetaceae bacterium]|nr:hypothetical protein [Planctomycetaceae bacterium]